ncbi:TraB/GumN family protein [Pseudotenacibaculum haliotis]|uniref:TraB/GumN family protein n=1 Tax=Pseudotenacibaculum haliotis TaxID=1862138 RepID=A0ABW5LWN5_9FLAO
MKKITAIIAFLLITVSTAFGQKLESTTLWKITGKGLEKPSYLFGTIHVTCDATLSDKVKEALDQTDQLVLEIDMDDPTMQGKMMQGMAMKEGKTLKDLVSEEDFQTIDKLFKEHLGMSVSLMQNVKPFFLLAAFYPKMIDCPMQSFELELMKVAQKQKEEIKGLETVEDQLQVFDDIPYDVQVKDLIKTAKDNLAHEKETIKKMLKIYKEENIEAMLDMMSEESSEVTSDYQNILLDNRNKNWISKIGVYAKEKPTFFGVGAGHLAGKNGVILLLRKAGYTVTPVK